MQYQTEVRIVKIVRLGVLTALAMALSWAEQLIPGSSVIPGGKIGFANIITLIALSRYGFKSATAITAVRCLLAALLYGGVMSLPYSFAGGFAALCVMYFLTKISALSITGVAIGGAFAHNLAQVTVAVLIMKNIYIYTYMPVLGLISVPAGAFTGICSGLCIRQMQNLKKGV